MFRLNKSLSKLKSISKKNNDDEDDENKNDVKKKTNKVLRDKRVRNDIKKKSKVKIVKKEINDLKRGVIVLHNIPHGFFENEMRRYFSQFGKVTRLRLSRSKKTKNSRGYAYIEFECDAVAKIVAETMNNYLMYDHILKCEYIPENKLPPKVFRGWNKEIATTVSIHKAKHNKERDNASEMKLVKHRIKTVKRMENALSEIGIDFKCEIVNIPSKTSEPLKEGESSKSKAHVEKDLMIVHSSDEDIEFKTPPNAIRVRKHKNPSNRSQEKRSPIEVLSIKTTPAKGKRATPAKGERSTPLRMISMSMIPKFLMLRAAASAKRKRIV